MTVEDPQDAATLILELKQGIREITHDISNPLGVLRMAAYYLQHGNPDKEKQEHYYTVITETVERVEAGLNRLRTLSQTPESGAGDGGHDGKGT